MAFDRWRIGMDMAPDVLRALALSRDGAQWRCRGWWQFPLPMARDAQGDPCPMAGTAEALRRWRRQLPRRLSVRLCLTGLPVTLTRLPSLPAALAWDWCLDAAHPERVLVVSARLSALLPWRRCLRAAGLPVHRLDIAAAALRRMARACGRHPALPLVHQCVSGAYHVAPLAQPLWLTHIEQRNGRLYISGCSEGYSPVVVLRRRLADHALLPDVRWREVRQRDAVRWQFFLEADSPAEDAA